MKEIIQKIGRINENISDQKLVSRNSQKSCSGYDPEEVQTFLESLADELDELHKENESLKAELRYFKCTV